MAGRQSWAETRWWHGTVFAWPAVLLGVALAVGFAAIALPALLVRHTVSRGLHDYYLTVYRSGCESSERRTAALPYVTRLNGTRRVIVHAEGGQSAALVNERFAYVAGSRMREGLDVYTDNSQQLASHLSSASSTRPQRYTTGASALARSSL
jgi:hypothetical protein